MIDEGLKNRAVPPTPPVPSAVPDTPALPVGVDRELYNLIENATNISKNTEGAFDITVTPLVELWGFYKKQGSLPSDAKIKEALASVGFNNIALDREK